MQTGYNIKKNKEHKKLMKDIGKSNIFLEMFKKNLIVSSTLFLSFSFFFQVYYFLLKVYLQPPEPSFLGLSSYGACSKPEPNVTAALRLMEEHAGCIETEKVGGLLLV